MSQIKRQWKINGLNNLIPFSCKNIPKAMNTTIWKLWIASLIEKDALFICITSKSLILIKKNFILRIFSKNPSLITIFKIWLSTINFTQMFQGFSLMESIKSSTTFMTRNEGSIILLLPKCYLVKWTRTLKSMIASKLKIFLRYNLTWIL